MGYLGLKCRGVLPIPLRSKTWACRSVMGARLCSVLSILGSDERIERGQTKIVEPFRLLDPRFLPHHTEDQPSPAYVELKRCPGGSSEAIEQSA